MIVGGRRIATDAALFVIAEIGLNHGGDVQRALALVDAAADAGASAVKLQTLRAADLVAPSCPPPAHVDATSLQDFFAAFELDEAAHHAVAARARGRGLPVLSTPFSEAAVDLLERVGVDAYKIASGDLTWHPLIERCAATGKPLIMSTGLATLAEIDAAVACARRAGAHALGLLHCVSAYPVPEGHENLRAIATLAARYDVPVGLSDHGRDTSAVPVAVTLGAAIYERHLILEGDDQAIDAAVSSTPRQLADAIAVARRTTAALGSGAKACDPAEAPNRIPSRRGLYAARDLAAGHVVTAADVRALRPATDLAPDRQHDLVGSTLRRAIAQGEPFVSADLDRADGSGNRGRGYRGVA